MDYLYSYIDKNNVNLIKKYGLLSLYGLYSVGLMDKFIKSASKYLDRGKIKKYHLTIDDVKDDPERFFNLFQKSNGKNSHKVVWFLFQSITPDLHKERDVFLKYTILTQVPLDIFKSDWTYYTLGFRSTRQWTLITLKELKSIKKIFNQKIYEMKKGGKFLFTNIPHLAIAPISGKIDPKNIIFKD